MRWQMSSGKQESEQYYKDLGFKCGLEIHQQLLTDRKLFCRCKAVLHTDKPTATILRHMRPTLSELGKYDGTALMEFKTKKNVVYQLYDDTVCTYEMDDTPPFQLNRQALDIALEIALLLKCSIVDEVHISRKQYLDGSIPTGFQRTGIIGVEGDLPYNGRTIRIIQLGLEEDACREITDKGHMILFRTDRLSIPLVEVVTYPDIHTPSEVEEVARLIGRLLRSTGKVRRGLGSIRQDVNVSISGGTRVELKGVSRLQYLKGAVAIEAGRQKALLEIRDELQKRGITASSLRCDECDVTTLFKKTKCKRFNEIVTKKQKIYAVILRQFSGLLDMPTQPGRVFGDEFAGRVRVIACLDVMPNIVYSTHFEQFGLGKKEIAQLEKTLQLTANDCAVLVWGDGADVRTAVDEIKIRATEALCGIPSETRQVFPDGTNDFERILPGPDRMYPDTDSPPTPIAEHDVSSLQEMLGEPIWVTEQKLTDMGLDASLVCSLSISPRLKVFYRIVQQLGVNPLLVAVTLEQHLTSLKRKRKPVERITDETIYSVFELLVKNKISKQALPTLFGFLAENLESSVLDAVEKLQIASISSQEMEKIVKTVLAHIPKKQANPISVHAVMGDVMKQLNNRADGRLVYEMVMKNMKSPLKD